MNVPQFDLAQAHRWFAIEFNNAAWEIVESQQSAACDVEHLIHLAHASVHHWLQVGKRINEQRGLSLLTAVYIFAPNPHAATRYAEACLQISEENPEGQNSFDRAMAVGGLAAARRLAGRAQEAKELYERLESARRTLDHPAEIALIDQLFPRPE